MNKVGNKKKFALIKITRPLFIYTQYLKHPLGDLEDYKDLLANFISATSRLLW